MKNMSFICEYKKALMHGHQVFSFKYFSKDSPVFTVSICTIAVNKDLIAWL